jgi:hypothetical protein
MSVSREGGTWARPGLARAAAILAVASLAGAPARGGDIQTRDFIVTVSGKPAGEVHMTIQKLDTGAVWMRCDTDINVPTVVGKYKFIYRGRELWKDQRLVQFDSNTDDNGKRFIVSAVAEQAGVRVKVNNVERPALSPAGVWLSSYWCLPDPRLRNAPLAIIDADNGRNLSGRLQFVANERVRVGGQEIPLNHYRLRGAKLDINLWYDGSDRLVRQEWVEQGHRTIVELVRVRR